MCWAWLKGAWLGGRSSLVGLLGVPNIGGRGFLEGVACDWSVLAVGGACVIFACGGVATEWAELVGVSIGCGRGFVLDVACDWSEPRERGV